MSVSTTELSVFADHLGYLGYTHEFNQELDSYRAKSDSHGSLSIAEFAGAIRPGRFLRLKMLMILRYCRSLMH